MWLCVLVERGVFGEVFVGEEIVVFVEVDFDLGEGGRFGKQHDYINFI